MGEAVKKNENPISFILAEYAQALAMAYDQERFKIALWCYINKANVQVNTEQINKLVNEGTNELYINWQPTNLSKLFYISLNSQKIAIQTIRQFQKLLQNMNVEVPNPPTEILEAISS